MIKNILAGAIVVALSACGGGSDDDDNVDTTPTTPAAPTTTDGGTVEPGTIPPSAGPIPTGGGAGPVTDTAAGSYVGTFGGATGVYVINNEFQLSGLAINADGSAQSLFGDVGSGDTFTGGLRQFIHQETLPVGTGDSFGSVAGAAAPLEIDVTIVNGQTIESTAESATAVSLLGTEGSSVAPATAASLAGTWEGVHGFCGMDADGALINCQLLTTTLTFNGTDVTGTSVFTDTEGAEFTTLIAGGITEFGDASLIDFTFGDAPGFSGLVFFNPAGDGRIAFVGENPGDVGPATIAGVLTLQP